MLWCGSSCSKALLLPEIQIPQDLRSSVDGVTDNTHFSQYGASRMGGLVPQSIREQRLPVAAYLR
jgi:hypothetical protein